MAQCCFAQGTEGGRRLPAVPTGLFRGRAEPRFSLQGAEGLVCRRERGLVSGALGSWLLGLPYPDSPVAPEGEAKYSVETFRGAW